MSSISLTPVNRALVKKLLRVGRWNNTSEIVRHGLHLVERELEEERRRALTPLTPEETRSIVEADDAHELRFWGRKSALPSKSYFDE
jgi:Arc/MetJ-type ribon-helix-helix transcriptional regulator